VNAGIVSKSPCSSIGLYAYYSSPQSLQLCSRPVTDAGAAALRAVSVRVSIVVAKRAVEDNTSCMRGVKEYEGRRADGGRREKESDHGGPWSRIMRLSAALCGRNMCGLGPGLLSPCDKQGYWGVITTRGSVGRL
jgi:hypothetical protein